MKRRSLLAVGIGMGTLLALGGGLALMVRPGVVGGKLSAPGRELFAAVARVVLAGLLPQDAAARHSALEAHIDRIDATLAGLPPPVQGEVAELVTLLASAPGRYALAGLGRPWAEAGDDELQAVMRGLQTSSLQVRQQVFHALRNLTNGAWFAAPESWAQVGYPGPRTI